MRVDLHQEGSEYLRGAAEALGVVRSVEELGGTSVNGGVRALLRPDARYDVVDGEEREIYKEPRTDVKKRSHRGLIAVVRDAAGRLKAEFPVSRAVEASEINLLRTVYEDGKIVRRTTRAEMRALVERELATAE